MSPCVRSIISLFPYIYTIFQHLTRHFFFVIYASILLIYKYIFSLLVSCEEKKLFSLHKRKMTFEVVCLWLSLPHHHLFIVFFVSLRISHAINGNIDISTKYFALLCDPLANFIRYRSCPYCAEYERRRQRRVVNKTITAAIMFVAGSSSSSAARTHSCRRGNPLTIISF